MVKPKYAKRLELDETMVGVAYEPVVQSGGNYKLSLSAERWESPFFFL